ncbi:isopeptide-forming domain-containing fimbrial protein [Streptococcus gallolyticus]|uniref:isopeptide-forming domain-containing fimbrial protein n=1 Tax=Streptococcus gallolyticus TaxID=315405 RepID=UPI002284DE12|nr:isopeptide-forming domain-containing fimbrial protein [Streptococcus gallolyticus]MCY7186080.1 isopeptide-forming domain-containing fimbrial protein [Streptococcus gallolyticus subsp. gallolyticus]MCY7189048.1 isopeptide-forming domain-containing fimbrial protein [Streptococcus gallolyticus subsp. gallolyticus]
MKKLKLIFATLLSVLFAFTGGKALAYDITVENGGNGTYESYQIFTGTLSEDGKTLSNIEWGNGITEAGQAALQEKYSVNSAAELAEVLGAEDFTASQAEEFAKAAGQYLQNAGGLTGLAAGYYLVQNASVGDNEAYTNYILQVVNNVTVEPKTSVPSVVKKVQDTNDTTGETSDWQDSADYDVNDSVPFQLTATLPDNIDSYDHYYVEFSDTLSKGLTFNEITSVKVGDTTLTSDQYTVKTNTDSESGETALSIVITDVKGVGATVTSSTKVVVEYTATLNSNAVIGSEGNPNTVKLIYSNNPNNTGDGTSKPGDTGETPEDTVVVFTYKVVVNKVDQNGDALEGAGFTLYKKDSSGNWNAVGDEITGVTTFEFERIDDGDYKLSETTTPNGYNTIDDVEFTISASHSEEADEPKLISLTGDVTSGTAEFTSSTTDGSLTTDVVNKKGSVLPSTGGMGTTILYVVGTILVLAAGILLVTKKRMDAK